MKKLIIGLSLSCAAVSGFSQQKAGSVIKNNTLSNTNAEKVIGTYYVPACATTNTGWLLGGNTVSNFTGIYSSYGGGQVLGTCDPYDMVFEAGGVPSMWLKTTTNQLGIGVGASAPTGQVDIVTSGTMNGLNILNGTSKLFSVDSYGNTIINSTTTSGSNPLTPVFIAQNSSVPNILMANALGYVGVGTGLPLAQVDISSINNGVPIIQLEALTTGSSHTPVFRVNGDGSAFIQNYGSSNTPLTVVGTNGTSITANFGNTAGYKTFLMSGAGSNGYYSGLVKSGDNAIIWDNGSNGANRTSGFVIAPWNGTQGGIRIDGPTGNVGIGNISPAAQLDINATANTTGAVKVEGISNATIFSLGTDGTTVINSTSSTNNPLTVQKSGTSLLLLDINGNFQSSGNIVMNNNPNGNPVTSAQLILKTYGGTGSADLNHGLGYYASFNTTKNSTQTAVAIDGPVLYGFSGGALATRNTGTSTSNIALQWNSNGQVFIGNQKQTTATGNHSSAALSVSGDVVIGNSSNTTGGIYVTTQNWADFVFDKNYELMSLNEVEKFYQKNHHLPNVPSEKEVKENGNNLAQTDVALLQKIEELTLYMVKQQKEINELKELVKKNNK